MINIYDLLKKTIQKIDHIEKYETVTSARFEIRDDGHLYAIYPDPPEAVSADNSVQDTRE